MIKKHMLTWATLTKKPNLQFLEIEKYETKFGKDFKRKKYQLVCPQENNGAHRNHTAR